MGRRYYCDYCDRSLPYSVDARKKHDSGHQHRNAKQIYYDRFKSARDHYQDEIKKNICKRFFSGQMCSFSDNCIFSHLTEPSLSALKTEADKEANRDEVPSLVSQGLEPDVDQIRSTLESHLSPALKRAEERVRSYRDPNPHSRDYHPLPPSMIPFNIEDLVDVNYNTWGW